MTEGNISAVVALSKKDVAIARGMGMTLPQLANKYGLSKEQMKLALQQMGFMKADEGDKPEKQTEREKKFAEVCQVHELTEDEVRQILEELGLEYKTGKRTKNAEKFTIIDDLKFEA